MASLETVVNSSENAASGSKEKYHGAIAQLGERLHGMQEVSGSIPLSSTKIQVSTLQFRLMPDGTC
ncbi:hypothetical protein CBM2587_A160330 [Cupriavidus taiwanensis]|uniref:Uncharacterized protein n=1 Tax=Cupriavidus taiwanensis TaxID=164546 RepID=A0A375BJB7_9BURK|nr:hypothetical protein CBM2587_A160330 [Cupriavidus taiwanensis]